MKEKLITIAIMIGLAIFAIGLSFLIDFIPVWGKIVLATLAIGIIVPKTYKDIYKFIKEMQNDR